MSVSKRQFTLLQAMGIELWQRKNIAEVEASVSVNEPEILAIDSLNIKGSQLFSDIIHCLGLSIGEITYLEHKLDLGLFNWQFSMSDEISFTESTLQSPVLSSIESSPQLKRQLWQKIQKNNLSCQ
jgi:DNA polymerase III psi subunit